MQCPVVAPPPRTNPPSSPKWSGCWAWWSSWKPRQLGSGCRRRGCCRRRCGRRWGREGGCVPSTRKPSTARTKPGNPARPMPRASPGTSCSPSLIRGSSPRCGTCRPTPQGRHILGFSGFAAARNRWPQRLPFGRLGLPPDGFGDCWKKMPARHRPCLPLGRSF